MKAGVRSFERTPAMVDSHVGRIRRAMRPARASWRGAGPSGYGQPWAYWLMKQVKSSTFSAGAVVDPSQLA
jgi:hypothetical protein